MFDLTENASDGSVINRKFRFIIENFTLRKNSASGTLVTTSQSTSLDGSQAMLSTADLLEAYTNYNISITLVAQELINGSWRTAKRNNNTEIREIVSQIDWPCEVQRHYADQNLGLKKRVSSGLDWVFSQVESAIILEDDCLPNQSFFKFCQSFWTSTYC
jgi:hypothetical protein